VIEILWIPGKEWATFSCPDGPSIAWWEPYDEGDELGIKSQLLAQMMGWT